MEFVNDPRVADLPVVGGDYLLAPMLVAQRVRCGVAMRWSARGGSLEALRDFCGSGFVIVADQLYRSSDRGLELVETRRSEWVVVKPPAGEVMFVSPVDFSAQWAWVSSDGAEPTVPEGAAVTEDASGSSLPDVAGEGAGDDVGRAPAGYAVDGTSPAPEPVKVKAAKKAGG